MAKIGKRRSKANENLDPDTAYELDAAVKMVKERATAKFDETIELAMNLGVDPRHADQMVRGMISLPKGTGKSVRVAVFAKGDKVDEASAAGADLVGGDHLFGGNDGIEQRHVNGAECHDVFSGGQDSRCPGQGFQATAIMVGFAAIPFPATEREQEIEPCFVRHFCGGEIL